jgi:heme/copper-type cytochrome/quinol oxidase subunit 2
MLHSAINEDESTPRKVTGVLVAVVLVVSALSFVGMGSYNNAYAQDNNKNNSNKLDVQVTKPSSDLTAQWWQWILSIPADENPTTDTTGEDCSQGDFGDTFFLAGTLGGKAERECTITEGQDILIPIVNTICIKTEEEETEESLLAICKDITDQAKNLQLIIDGKHV